MTQQEFLVKVSEMLEAEPALTGAEVLSDLGTWDSLAVMSLMALAEAECGIVLAPKDIGTCNTVNDLVALVYERNAA
jgi:acyl carrier protein